VPFYPEGRVMPRVVALLPLLLAGCVPGPGWLPDSSGFVYTGGPKGDQLRLYDLKTKKSRVLVEKEAGPAWPRLSPDGKRIAVARRLAPREGTQRLDVQVFDLQGRRQFHEEIDWRHGPHTLTMRDSETPVACWSPDGGTLLLGMEWKSALFDLKTRELSAEGGPLLVFGDGPVRPDGKGFLRAEEKTGWPASFVGWDGKARDLGSLDRTGLTIHFTLTPWLHGGRWDGATAEYAWSSIRLRLDTEAAGIRRDEVPVEKSADGKRIVQRFAFASGAVVRLVELKPRTPQEPGEHRLEAVRPDGGKGVVVKEKVGGAMLTPAPDGKKVAVRWAATVKDLERPRDGEFGFVVLDDRGDVLADFDPKKE
jgi:hypothetical protein